MSERQCVSTPLTTLWDAAGEFGRCVRDTITEDDIRTLLRQIPVSFVEVDLGKPLRWIPQEEGFAFWKAVRASLHRPESPFLEDYPGAFFYFASEWAGRDDACIVVLTKAH